MSWQQNRVEYQTSINARLSSAPVAAVIPGNSAAEYVLTSGIYSFLSIYNALLVGRILLTWFPSAPPSIVGPLSSICDPYLNLFRGIIPPLGQIDVSPILAFTGTAKGRVCVAYTLFALDLSFVHVIFCTCSPKLFLERRCCSALRNSKGEQWRSWWQRLLWPSAYQHLNGLVDSDALDEEKT